jgi:Rod binding domain-containing protein
MRKLREAVADFEALLLSHMLKSMQGTVAKADLGVDSGGDVLKEVGWEKVGQSLAHKGGLGLGDMLFKALSKRVLATSSEAEVKPSTLEDLVGSARLGRHMMPLGTPDKE